MVMLERRDVAGYTAAAGGAGAELSPPDAVVGGRGGGAVVKVAGWPGGRATCMKIGWGSNPHRLAQDLESESWDQSLALLTLPGLDSRTDLGSRPQRGPGRTAQI